MQMTSELHKKALSARMGTVCSALAELIRLRQFVLSQQDLTLLESRGDPFIDGWVLAYRYYSAPSEHHEMLRLGLASSNARVREQACDIVGDNAIHEFRPELEALSHDGEAFVAEAASYCLVQLHMA